MRELEINDNRYFREEIMLLKLVICSQSFNHSPKIPSSLEHDHLTSNTEIFLNTFKISSDLSQSSINMEYFKSCNCHLSVFEKR